VIAPANRVIAPANRAIAAFNRAIAAFNRAIAPANRAIAPANRAIAPFNCAIAPFNCAIAATIRAIAATIRAISASVYGDRIPVAKNSIGHNPVGGAARISAVDPDVLFLNIEGIRIMEHMPDERVFNLRGQNREAGDVRRKERAKKTKIAKRAARLAFCREKG
jgi:hypothetical protein